jgi:hypothetical protein
MMLKRLLRREDKGIGAVEFALVAPVLIAFVIGIAQMGKLFFANADMKNAMAHGARVASIWPVPDDSVILAAVNERIARTRGLADAQVTIKRDEDGVGNDSVEIEMSYHVPLDFIVYDVGSVTLRDSRKVFIQMAGTVPQNDNGGTTTGSTTSTTTGGTTSTTSGGTTTSTTSGGTTTTSTTSGGTTSSTSATSAGGTTSSTSSTSASSTGGTSASSTTSASSSNGNGNGNGSSGHAHGNCRRRC